MFDTNRHRAYRLGVPRAGRGPGRMSMRRRGSDERVMTVQAVSTDVQRVAVESREANGAASASEPNDAPGARPPDYRARTEG